MHCGAEVTESSTNKQHHLSHVPTSVDAYNDGALEEWFDDRDLATDLLLSLNINRLSSMD